MTTRKSNRYVPIMTMDGARNRLKAQAALEGMSLSEYVDRLSREVSITAHKKKGVSRDNETFLKF